MTIHLTLEQKLELEKLINAGEDELALLRVKKHAVCNTNEAKAYINNFKRHMNQKESDTTEEEY